MSIFYIVGTPIGNLEDMTLRAIRILKEVDVILCEDTRVTQKLLKRYEINGKQLTTYNAQKSSASINKIEDWIREGKNLALVSDAGTPGISDPGSELVAKLRGEFYKEELQIVVIPGASALTSAISAAGIPAAGFVFLGFLPHKKGRETLFKEIAKSERAIIFYESPHRIIKTIEKLVEILPSERRITLARELTKIHEEFVTGNAKEILSYFKNNSDHVRGEFVVIVSKC
jgi:16S rRNA (cytidine1402-2'-O)-methyltransferase